MVNTSTYAFVPQIVSVRDITDVFESQVWNRGTIATRGESPAMTAARCDGKQTAKASTNFGERLVSIELLFAIQKYAHGWRGDTDKLPRASKVTDLLAAFRVNRASTVCCGVVGYTLLTEPSASRK